VKPWLQLQPASGAKTLEPVRSIPCYTPLNWSGASSAESGCGGGVGGVERKQRATLVGSQSPGSGEHLALRPFGGRLTSESETLKGVSWSDPSRGITGHPPRTLPTRIARCFLVVGVAAGRCASDVEPREGCNDAGQRQAPSQSQKPTENQKT
jgi:hypothetical protein